MKFTSAYANTHFAIFQRPNDVANKLNKKFPAGCSERSLCKEFGVDRVGNNLDAILELAVALDLISEEYEGDERIFKATC